MSVEFIAAEKIADAIRGLRDELDNVVSQMPTRSERIATAALQGMIASPSYSRNGPHETVADHEKRLAHHAVRFADALIAELDK